MYGSTEWYGPDGYLKNTPGSFGVAAPAHLVRRLSTQKRAARKVAAVTEPRKPYDEKPLPVGMEPPPEWFVYVGERMRGIKAPYFRAHKDGAWHVNHPSQTESDGSFLHYAAPAELCNRLPLPPESQRVIAAPVEPVKGRFEVSHGVMCVGRFDTAEDAYVSAEKMALSNPEDTIYVYQLLAKFTASVNVNRTDY